MIQQVNQHSIPKFFFLVLFSLISVEYRNSVLSTAIRWRTRIYGFT